MVEDIIYIYIYKELICYILTKTWEHISIYTERMIGRRSVLNGNLNKQDKHLSVIQNKYLSVKIFEKIYF